MPIPISQRLKLAFIVPVFALCTLKVEGLRLNEIQAIGSHNSYHLAPPVEVLELIGKFRKDAVSAWNYSHPPLLEQLEREGLRQFELDVYADPEGGLYANPLAMKLAALTGKKLDAFDPDGVMAKPGFKVLHVPDLDCWSNSRTLRQALEDFASWSSANPNHQPVMILIECLDEAYPPAPTKPPKFTREVLLALEKEVLSQIPVKNIIRPDDIRGSEQSLPAALAKHGWPRLDDLRGKFLFMLDNDGRIRNTYLQDNQNLAGRLLFVSAPNEKHPAAAFFKINDALRNSERIRHLVKNGFVVRTRADIELVDTERRDTAFASGAQWVSTDYFSGKTSKDKRVVFDNGQMFRTNPITGIKKAASAEP